MARELKIFLLLIVSVLFTSLIGLNNTVSCRVPSTPVNYTASQKQQFKLIEAPNSSCYTIPSEVSIAVNNGFSLTLRIHPGKVYAPFANAIENVFYCAFIQYHFYSYNGWLGFLSPNLIFPFHYFW
ncbi:hypothetical protein [Adhaeribacter aquaticus]|uniref:hypothetical protein n=1 Tax=Adhaeribacter aquaticus TaxID=299567 RepID=UPI00047B1A60|nr:hypothetical protein [Adhaeribacter aquaticus]